MTRHWSLVLAAICCSLAAPCLEAAERDLGAEVRAAEQAFARTMADRDHAAFATHVAQEAVFFDRKGPIRGRETIVAAWKPFFEGKEAPFSWEPETVEVLPSGALALSSGPVRDRAGARIGTFLSIWRLESDGRWRVVFDKGCDACPEKKP